MKPPRGNYRWTICALLFFGTAINYIDRQILGVLKPLLSADLRWSDVGYANIVTAFQFAYAFGYLFGGRLMDKFGVRRGLPVAATIWSLAAAAHGVVRSVAGFSCARLVLGAAEGSNFPAAIRVVSDWFPIKDRALATGIFNSAANVGAIVCPLAIPIFAVRFGWQAAFFVTGALGLLWVVAWIRAYQSPETHPKLTEEERQYIEQGRVKTDDIEIPWRQLLSMRTTWAYTIASALTGMVWWFYIFWFPDFVHKRFHYSTVKSGLFTSLVYAISLLGSLGGGFLAARLIGRGWSINNARKFSMLVPAVCVVPVYFAASVHSIWLAVSLVGIAAASHQAWSANLYTFASDVMPKRMISSLVGLGGFMSGLASIGMAQSVGYVLKDTGSYTLIFAGAAPMYVISLLIIQLLVPNIEQHKHKGSASVRESRSDLVLDH